MQQSQSPLASAFLPGNHADPPYSRTLSHGYVLESGFEEQPSGTMPVAVCSDQGSTCTCWAADNRQSGSVCGDTAQIPPN